MGEMQGALARARLESLLRPRHKKRVEAQKRSESVLLSGLGKCCRPARPDSGSAEIRAEYSGGTWRLRAGLGTGHRGGEREGGEVSGEPCIAVSTRAARERKWKITEALHPSGSFLRPRRTEAECIPAGSCSRSLWKPRFCLGRLARIAQDTAATRPSSRNSVYSLLGGWDRAGRRAGPCCGRGPEWLPGPACPAPWRLRAYKVGRRAGAHCWLSQSHCSFSLFGHFPNIGAMTVKTEAARSTLTYSRMRGMVAILIAFMKQRRMGLNDFIQKLANNSYACKHPEVQSYLKISQPQEPELMNANPSPPPSPSQQINLGPSSNPHAKPSDFHFLKVIGKGSFGKVLLARHKAEEAFYAVKVLQKKAILKKKEEKHIMSERNVLLKNVKHPFLVGLHFSFQTADKLYFVLDYINGGELFYHLQRERCFLEPRARFYAAEIASALGYLHSLNIVYRDLKPENILLDSQGHIVLTDFGLCKENIEHNGTTSTFCGTPEYLAPEVLHKQPYDRTVDWWCLGAVLYEMLYGLPPFYSRNTAEMYDNILNKPLQLKPNITNSARHLLEGLLQKDRTKRLGAKDDFMEIKSHIFFSLINWDDLINKKITPPFNPNVSGPSDLRHFDPEFTEEPVPSSIGRSPDSILVTASVKEAAEAFLGFSYAPPMDSFL